jgi:hypothetical protein
VTVALQPFTIRWPPVNVQSAVQPDSGSSPVLVTVTVAVNPLFQELSVRSVAEHCRPSPGGSVGGSVVPPTSTENAFVRRPCPPCQISNPASTSIRYQSSSTASRATASLVKARRSRSSTDAVPAVRT